jgi:hypothetical protein
MQRHTNRAQVVRHDGSKTHRAKQLTDSGICKIDATKTLTWKYEFTTTKVPDSRKVD